MYRRLLPMLPVAGMLLAAWFRLHGLEARGIHYHDEALFMATGKYHAGLIRALAEGFTGGGVTVEGLLDRAREMWLEGGTPWMRAHALHEYLLIALFAVFGPSDTLSLLVSAICGLLTMLCLATFGWPAPERGYDTRARFVGLAAACILGFSVWHLHYSLAGLSQSFSLLCACLVLKWLWDRPAGRLAPRRLALLGMMIGAAFTSHYNLFWLVPMACAWAGAGEWKNRINIPDFGRRMALMGAGVLLPPLLCELPHRLLRWWIAGSPFVPFERIDMLRQMPGYFEQILHQVLFFEISEPPPGPLSPLFLPRALLEIESPAFVLLLAFGLAGILSRGRRGDARAGLLLAWISLPCLIWTLLGYPGLRSFLPVLPALCLGAASAVRDLAGMAAWRARPAARSAILAGGALLLVGFQVPRLDKVASAVSPWKRLSDLVLDHEREHGPVRIADAELSDHNRAVYRLYLGRRIDRGIRRGTHFLFDPTSLDQRWNRRERVAAAADSARPVVSFRNDFGRGMLLRDCFDPWFIREYRSGRLGRTFALYDGSPDGMGPPEEPHQGGPPDSRVRTAAAHGRLR